MDKPCLPLERLHKAIQKARGGVMIGGEPDLSFDTVFKVCIIIMYMSIYIFTHTQTDREHMMLFSGKQTLRYIFHSLVTHKVRLHLIFHVNEGTFSVFIFETQDIIHTQCLCPKPKATRCHVRSVMTQYAVFCF